MGPRGEKLCLALDRGIREPSFPPRGVPEEGRLTRRSWAASMVGMDAYHRFDRAMTQLEDWYSDSTRAMALDAQGGSGTKEHGHAILRRNQYPGPRWRELWAGLDANDTEGERLIIEAVEDELYGLDHGPSQASPAAGLHRGTAEWRLAVATADGSLRAVARRFGISHTEVRRIRDAEGVTP